MGQSMTPLSQNWNLIWGMLSWDWGTTRREFQIRIGISPFDGPPNQWSGIPLSMSFSLLFLFSVFFSVLSTAFSFSVYCLILSLSHTHSLFFVVLFCFPLDLFLHMTVHCPSIRFPSLPLYQTQITNAGLHTHQWKLGHWAAQKTQDKCYMGIWISMGYFAVVSLQELFPSTILSYSP